MGYGPVATARLTATDPAPAGAPGLVVVDTIGSYQATVTLPADSDVVGVTLAWIEVEPGTNPFEGLSMDEIKALDGVTVHSITGGPSEEKQFSENWPDSVDDGDEVVFACAATDDSSDFED